MYSQMLCLNNWDVFHNPAEKDCSPGVDAAETVRFSWKVVEPQGQREHDVRVSQAMDGVCRRPRYDEKHLATFL